MQASAYLVYGTEDSDRRAIIYDLLNHLEPSKPRLFFTSSGRCPIIMGCSDCRYSAGISGKLGA